MPSRETIGRWAVAVVATVVGIWLLVWLFEKLVPATALAWTTFGNLALSLALAFGAVAMLRFALAPLIFTDQSRQGGAAGTAVSTPADADVALRSRIAPVVVAIGSVAIIVLALAVVIAFANIAVGDDNLKGKLDTLLLGVFTAVLPVFATWVGTVIAFYFTDASFRLAAQTAREATAAASQPREQPRVAERMIPYEKIAKIVHPRATARQISMTEVIAKLKEPVTRVIVFDDPSRQPVFVLRKKLIPTSWPPDGTGKVIDDYLQENGGTNAADAAQFDFVAQSATLDAARKKMGAKVNTVHFTILTAAVKSIRIVG
jgi:hypothetical protein